MNDVKRYDKDRLEILPNSELTLEAKLVDSPAKVNWPLAVCVVAFCVMILGMCAVMAWWTK